MTALNFNAQNVAPATGQPDPAPAGWYKMAIEASEAKPTKDSATTGNKFLEMKVGILEGAHQGKKVYVRLNLWNANPVASEIASKELSAIAHATGVMMIQDSQQLHGIPMMCKVKLRPGDGQYEASNEITAWRPANFVPDAAPGAGGAMAAGAMPPGAAAMPPQQQPWAQGGGVPPAQPWAQPPQNTQQPIQQPQQQQPWAQPAAPAPAPAPVQQQSAPAGWYPDGRGGWTQTPPGQPPAAQPPAQPPAQPAWAGAPAPAGAPQQPWQQPQQPAAPQAGPGAFPPPGQPDPQQAVPPWQRPAGQ